MGDGEWGRRAEARGAFDCREDGQWLQVVVVVVIVVVVMVVVVVEVVVELGRVEAWPRHGNCSPASCRLLTKQCCAVHTMRCAVQPPA